MSTAFAVIPQNPLASSDSKNSSMPHESHRTSWDTRESYNYLLKNEFLFRCLSLLKKNMKIQILFHVIIKRLTIPHDGENNNCKPEDHFIMNGKPKKSRPNTLYFSNCSINALEKKFKSRSL